MAEALDRAPLRAVSAHEVSAPYKHVHVVGAGLAGLAAAMSAVDRGLRVTLHEAGPAAGGRCRSYFDRALGCRIDNGNHLLLSGNSAAFAFLDQVGSRGTLAGPREAAFPFMDLGSGERWTVRPSRGRLPFWLLRPTRRVPGTRLVDYLQLLALRRANAGATVAATLAPGALYRRLLEPLAVAALNTPPETASARLLAAVIGESLAEGAAACIPAFPREGLSETFVDPALAYLRSRGAEIRLASRIAAVAQAGGGVAGLGPEALASDDAVVLAVPAPVAAALLPGLTVPDAFESILNLHYRFDAAPPGGFGEAQFIGLIGGLAEWAFVKPGVVSVTISAANRHLDADPVALAQQVWQELRTVLGIEEPIPPWRVLKEKRATFAATPDQDGKRPPPRTALANLVLAGDWTATGLPATIEGAIRSGRRAVDTLLSPGRE